MKKTAFLMVFIFISQIFLGSLEAVTSRLYVTDQGDNSVKFFDDVGGSWNLSFQIPQLTGPVFSYIPTGVTASDQYVHTVWNSDPIGVYKTYITQKSGVNVLDFTRINETAIDIASDTGYYYVADDVSGDVYKYALDASSLFKFSDAAGWDSDDHKPYVLTVDSGDDGYVYWSMRDYENEKSDIFRTKKDGLETEKILDGTDIDLKGSSIEGIAVDDEYLYFSEIATQKIYRADKDDVVGTFAMLFEGAYATSPGALALDDTYLYWINNGTEEIYRALKGGGTPDLLISGADFIAEGGGNFFDIAIDPTIVPVPEPSTYLLLGSFLVMMGWKRAIRRVS